MSKPHAYNSPSFIILACAEYGLSPRSLLNWSPLFSPPLPFSLSLSFPSLFLSFNHHSLSFSHARVCAPTHTHIHRLTNQTDRISVFSSWFLVCYNLHLNMNLLYITWILYYHYSYYYMNIHFQNIGIWSCWCPFQLCGERNRK